MLDSVMENVWLDEYAYDAVQLWALEQIDKNYAASALWMFRPLPTPRVFGMACAEQYRLGLKHDSYRAGLTSNS